MDQFFLDDVQPGDSGEDGAHGVGSGESVVLVVAEVLDNLTAILHESARQKEVCQIDIDNIYDKVQNFTEKKLNSNEKFRCAQRKNSFLPSQNIHYYDGEYCESMQYIF